MTKTFDHLIVLGRPASGKSEFIDFMKNVPERERAERYHIGRFEVLDDFLWLWEKCEEDDMWEKIGEKRLYSDRDGQGYVFKENTKLLEMMFEKFNHEVSKRYLSRPEFYLDATLIIEFSRGEGDGGYKRALDILSDEILARAAILYIDVSYEESVRRNIARYQEKLKHSILAHKVPDKDMERFSRHSDWDKLTKGRSDGYIEVRQLKVPFVTMNNEPESTDPVILDGRYGKALRRLMELRSEY